MSASASTLRVAEQAVVGFNAAYPVGTRVYYWPGRLTSGKRTSWTRGPARVYGDDLPCVPVEGHPGAITLTHVQPVPDPHLATVRRCEQLLADMRREAENLDVDDVTNESDLYRLAADIDALTLALAGDASWEAS